MRLTRTVAAFIHSARIAHFATADAAGQPHVVPICFVFDGRRIYSPIDEKPKTRSPLRLKRVRNIASNSRVAVIVDRYDEDWNRLAYVLISGTARLLHRGTSHRKAVAMLRRKYPQYRVMSIGKRPIIHITPIRLSCWGAL
jgi:PPOX class probable F420-dependent enzyme